MTIVRDARLHVRVDDGWLDAGNGVVTPLPPVDPTDWEAAFASRNFDTLTAYYESITGRDPELDYATVASLTITDAWLAANVGNGHVTFADGRWLIERYRSNGVITANADNVTLRNCWVDSTGALYAIRSQTNCHGLLVEHTTLAGNQANPNGATINFPDATDADQVSFRFVNMSGWRAGIYCFAGITAEYCYSHDLYFTEGSHNTGASIRGGNVLLRRNLITDGNSSALSFYPEVGPYTNVVATENAFRLQDSDTGPEVILAAGRPFSEISPGDTRLLTDNLFYRGGNIGGAGGIGGYLAGFSEISGNVDRNGDPVPA